MRPGNTRLLASLAGALLSASTAFAQGGPPPASPVRFTEAREREVRADIVLPGSVESATSSVVASEVAGLVEALRARDGMTVLKGQELARLRTADLDLRLKSSEAQLKEAESRLKLAEKNLQRARELFDARVVAQSQLDDAFYEFTAWQGRVEQLTADSARYRLDIEKSSIKAPFAGTVVRERTEVGEWIPIGGAIVEIVSLADLEVKIDVPEKWFSRMNPGASTTVTFESLEGYEIQGRVSAIVPRADAQARTFPIKVRIPNRDGRVGVGMLATVSLPAGEAYRATVVPKDAVVSQGRETIVYLIRDDDTVAPVTVRTGAGIGAWIVVQGDVKPGSRVVTRGNERLFPGQAVKGQPIEYVLP